MKRLVSLLVLATFLVLATSVAMAASNIQTIPEDFAEKIAQANLAVSEAVAEAVAQAAEVSTADPVKATKEYSKIASALKRETDRIVAPVKREAAKYGIALSFFEVEVTIGTVTVMIDPIHVAGD